MFNYGQKQDLCDLVLLKVVKEWLIYLNLYALLTFYPSQLSQSCYISTLIESGERHGNQKQHF